MSTDETTALICFYAARLDEEEARARALIHSDKSAKCAHWTAHPDGNGFVIGDESGHFGFCIVGGEGVARHVIRHDPARTLREVERGRRMVERYALAANAVQQGSVVTFTRGQDSGYAEACLDAIREAAAVHDGHPDYLPAFRPE